MKKRQSLYQMRIEEEQKLKEKKARERLRLLEEKKQVSDVEVYELHVAFLIIQYPQNLEQLKKEWFLSLPPVSVRKKLDEVCKNVYAVCLCDFPYLILILRFLITFPVINRNGFLITAKRDLEILFAHHWEKSKQHFPSIPSSIFMETQTQTKFSMLFDTDILLTGKNCVRIPSI